MAYLLISLALLQGFYGFQQWKSNNEIDKAHLIYDELEAPLPNGFPLKKDPYTTDKTNEVLPESVEVTPEYVFSYNPNPASEFLKLNPDYVGHINVPGTKVNYPIVKARDNDFYLNRNFYRENDPLGSIFMDYRNIGMHLDKHTIVYGHYTERGYMFGDLDKYLDKDFLLENQVIEFSTPQGVKFYKVFSIHISTKINSHLDTTFQQTSFSDFVTTLSDLSLVEGLDKPDTTKQILTLSTCNYAVKDGRLFLHAVEIENPN